MRVAEYCTKEVAVAAGDTGIAEAARRMRADHVGDLVVVSESEGQRRPVAIVTDRDLVIEVMAAGIDPETVTLGDLPSRELAVAAGDDDLMDTLQRMRELGVRRMPVVDANGLLTGILAVDDVLPVISELTSNLVGLLAREVAQEVHQRPVPVPGAAGST